MNSENEQMFEFEAEVITMTAVNNINYYRTNTYRTGRTDSVASMIARAIGADSYTVPGILRRLSQLKQTKVPTIVEINGIENDYTRRKDDVDKLFSFLSDFSKRHKLVKFTVMIGSMRYVL